MALTLTDKQKLIADGTWAVVSGRGGDLSQIAAIIAEVRTAVNDILGKSNEWISVSDELPAGASEQSPWIGLGWLAAEPTPAPRLIWWEGGMNYWFVTSAGAKGAQIPVPVTYWMEIAPPG